MLPGWKTPKIENWITLFKATYVTMQYQSWCNLICCQEGNHQSQKWKLPSSKWLRSQGSTGHDVTSYVANMVNPKNRSTPDPLQRDVGQTAVPMLLGWKTPKQKHTWPSSRRHRSQGRTNADMTSYAAWTVNPKDRSMRYPLQGNIGHKVIPVHMVPRWKTSKTEVWSKSQFSTSADVPSHIARMVNPKDRSAPDPFERDVGLGARLCGEALVLREGHLCGVVHDDPHAGRLGRRLHVVRLVDEQHQLQTCGPTTHTSLPVRNYNQYSTQRAVSTQDVGRVSASKTNMAKGSPGSRKGLESNPH